MLADSNATLSFDKSNIPSLSDIADRFYDIDKYLNVKVDHSGYINELNGVAPFTGIVSIRNIINMLNRDINVIVSDLDLIKLRNSIIFYNEYFCPSEDNITNCKPALTAFDRIEYKYLSIIGNNDIISKIKNPFIDLL